MTDVEPIERIPLIPLFENLPMHLNLADAFGSPMDAIGWAKALQNPVTRKTTLVIELDELTSEKLANLAEVFDLKAIGFAGIKRRPQDGG